MASAALDTARDLANGIYEAHNLMKRYGNVVVLRDVSLTMRPGSVHTIMGENGAGKSTAFKNSVRPRQTDQRRAAS